ncbi:MAG: septum formation initiator family protein [Schwartzia sp.]|nr:septum formation initiator family protein [Schwartzia sp. (in: firmicutes)]
MKERQGGWRPSVFTLLVTAWLIGFGYTFYTQQTHLDEVADDRAEAVAKLEAERARNEALKAERDGLSKPEYVEKVAREELGMTRNGEMPYIAAKK